MGAATSCFCRLAGRLSRLGLTVRCLNWLKALLWQTLQLIVERWPKKFISSAIEKNSTVCDRNDTQIQSHNDTQDYLIKLLSTYFTVPQLGNCDIDFFVFSHCFRIASLKFLKLNRVWNVAKKIWTVKEQKREITKLDSPCYEILSKFVKFDQNLLNFIKIC